MKLIKRLGAGFISNVYMAESPDSSIPLCIKIVAMNYPGAYTEETASEDVLYQKGILQSISHPFVIKSFPHVLPHTPGCLATELGVCTLQELQAKLDIEQKEWSNCFDPVAVKYFAAQVFLAVTHLHERRIRWDDAKQVNIVIMPDFTLRLIDVGTTFDWTGTTHRDHYHVAGMLHNLTTGSGELFLNRSLDDYQTLFRTFQKACTPAFQDLLHCLLQLSNFITLLSHPYWSDCVNGDATTSVDLTSTSGREIQALESLRDAAWRSLPAHSRRWLLDSGVSNSGAMDGVYTVAISTLVGVGSKI